MANPYCKKTEAENHLRYYQGWKAGNKCRINGTMALASRRWPQAYRFGYSDGLAGR